MNLLELLLDSQGKPAMKQLASSFGLSEEQATRAVSEMVPALSRGMQHNLNKPNGLEDLMGALTRGNHQRYLDRPDSLAEQAAGQEGNAILGHILGSKDVSRRVANHAASTTGIDSGLLKKMLPVIATMVMGSMSKQAGASQLPGNLAGGQADKGVAGMLTQLLDADRDGSVLDDIMGMAGKLF